MIRAGVGIVLAAALACAIATPAFAQEAPRAYPVGVYVTSVNHIDAKSRTAGVEMWLWSVSPDGRRPLKTVELVNADRYRLTLASTQRRPQGAWSQVKVAGTFRQLWDFKDFPFDRQTVSVVLEEGVLDTTSFVYRVDRRNSGYDPEIEIPGWHVTAFSIGGRTQPYETSFGDPALGSGRSDYSRVVAVLTLDRAHAALTFFTLTVAMYAAVLMALASFFLHPDTMSDLGARMGLLAAALFAAVLNMLDTSNEIGETEGLSLLDQLHVVAFVVIIAATALGIMARTRLERGVEPERIRRLDHLSFGVAAALVVVANVVLIGLAT